MDVALGKGPAIKVKDSSLISHPFVRRLMIETAEKNKIPYQLEVLEKGAPMPEPYTSAGKVCLRELSPSPLSLCTYASEMVDRSDVENAVILLEKLCLSAGWAG